MADDRPVNALVQRAQRACEDIATAHNDILVTLAETRQILAAVRSEAALIPHRPGPASVRTPPALRRLDDEHQRKLDERS